MSTPGADQLSRALARRNAAWRVPLAQMRRVEHFQQTLVNWLLPPEASPLELTLSFEQLAIELTAMVVQQEPDPYLAQVHRFGMLEDFDHLYRYAALLDQLEGEDPNTIVQGYTDICVGRPTREQHWAPVDDVRLPYDRMTASAISKLNAWTMVASEKQQATFI